MLESTFERARQLERGPASFCRDLVVWRRRGSPDPLLTTGHVCLVGGFGLYTRTLGEETITIRELYSHVGQEDIVIEALKDFPDNVAAFACHGHLTKADYETVLIPDIEDKLRRHKKLRYYTETAPDFVGMDPGAVWGDTKFGFSHWFDWERGAMVTDVEWITRAVKFFSLFGFLMPGEVRVFPTAEASKAREWIVEPQQ